jgi:hypothetical protein
MNIEIISFHLLSLFPGSLILGSVSAKKIPGYLGFPENYCA